MKQKRPTLNDVADEAGVSLATASIALNKSKRVHISQTTRDKVMEAANTLGYKPRAQQKSSAQLQPTKRVAYIVNHLDRDISINAVNGARETAWQHDYILHAMSYANDSELKAALVDEVKKGDFSGIIIGSNVTREISLPELPESIPTVLLNCYCKEKIEWPTILPADLIGAHQITQHLIDKGYQRIAHISGEEWMDASKQRLDGYRRALVSNNHIIDEQLIVAGNWMFDESYHQTLKLMQLASPPDAIFAATDEMAVGVYFALKELSLSIPEDVAVVGYDNTSLASHLVPSLTTMALPYYEMGQLAAETLLNLLAGQSLTFKNIKLEGKLIARNST
ncbi:LacI family DNA-binding transcriptional regulator [Vibrio aestuarianus]|uniref:LacI-family regulatory protein n=1 Tax=Vibrio aestuarianus TaxID=28171 RepID=A0ABM9FSG3_9VIBR|nr:LacI family DNA-binding transcriptional regulator [Vibrio aestuarianus]MDE1213378.1 LacI family DNA-binding transcriptional regulator [Vibrio aestuarianus]MDE1217642.1 LacI family DNA-binding transcriptional regulator [Vibrio aestuarianus]MDE1228913.1 LacI family DNA-binding transcriptional regulator [Vibrio aestuarianus]MDE1257380.1 LacI family DNA-binding transcriptional regulator [Vibrio aestuarianus]MDE1260443.1 LacI family DNA-binding transcriptional regulator [Vibrio aestuarianus]